MRATKKADAEGNTDWEKSAVPPACRYTASHWIPLRSLRGDPVFQTKSVPEAISNPHRTAPKRSQDPAWVDKTTLSYRAFAAQLFVVWRAARCFLHMSAIFHVRKHGARWRTCSPRICVLKPWGDGYIRVQRNLGTMVVGDCWSVSDTQPRYWELYGSPVGLGSCFGCARVSVQKLVVSAM